MNRVVGPSAQIQHPGKTGLLGGIILFNKTRQGYARKRILKPAGYFFVACFS